VRLESRVQKRVPSCNFSNKADDNIGMKRNSQQRSSYVSQFKNMVNRLKWTLKGNEFNHADIPRYRLVPFVLCNQTCIPSMVLTQSEYK